MEREDRLRDLFVAGQGLVGEELRTHVERHCAGDPGLRADLESLLALRSEARAFLERPLLRVTSVLDEAARAAAPLAPGQRLGDFVIERFLSRGGGGEVYEARQLSLGRAVALKLLHPTLQRDRARFEREARTAASLHHPHLVPVFGSGEEAGRPYYVMRLVRGPSLEAVRASQRGAPGGEARRRLVERLAEVARALEALHAQHLVHGDVKPANVLLEGGRAGSELEAAAVLVDFGLTRSLEAAQSTRFATPGYAAPEVLAGARTNERGDVYGLGLCAFDLLSAGDPAARPRRADGRFVSLHEFVPGLDRDLAAVVARCLDPVPEWRYADGGALAEDLVRWLRGEPVAARRLSLATRLRRWARRNPARILAWLARGAAVLGIAAAGAGVVRLAGWRGEGAAIERAWHEGRLEEAVRGLRGFPRFLEAWHPAALAMLAADLAAGETPAARVASELERAGSASARLLAARFLERDGAHAHPVLAEFLGQELAPGREDPRLGAAALAARVFYERPDREPAATSASEPIRRRLRALFAQPTDRDGVETLSAVTALAGCGTPADIPLLLGWLDAHPGGEPAEPFERTRLTLCALATLTRRTLECGLGAEFGAQVGERELERGCALVDRLRAVPDEALEALDGFLGSWLQADAFVRRDLGLPQPAVLPGSGGDRRWARVRAAREDPALVALLRGGLGAFRNPEALALHAVQEFGELVGAYDDPTLADELAPMVRAFAVAEYESPERALELFERSVQETRAHRTGLFEALLPDADTHLGVGLDAHDDPMAALEALPIALADIDLAFYERLLMVSGGLQAYADFTRQAARVAAGTTLAGRAVRLRTDDLYPRRSTLRFALAGTSRLELAFASERASEHLALVLEVQKANRSGLPHLGRATLTLEADGLACAKVRVTRGSYELLFVPVPSSARPQGTTRTLALELAEESDTTLWLHRLALYKTGPYETWR